MRIVRLLPLVLLALPGCFFIGTGSGEDGGLAVSAEIASVSLANDCPTSGLTDSAAPGLVAGDCAIAATNCGFCQQSTLQLDFKAGAARPNSSDAAVVEVVTVRILDASTNRVLDEVSARAPTQFVNDRFQAWNEQVAAGRQVRASYKLEAPDWTKIGSGEAFRTRSMPLRVEVVLRIDGVLRTLRSGEITREPEVVT